MKTRIFQTFAVAAILALAAACTDVTTEPESTVSSGNVFKDPAAYRSFLAKLYSGLSVTGMEGRDGAGSADIAGIDEGFSQYVRQFWQLQELPTDEAIIGWGDADLPEMNTQQWGSSNQFVKALYYRIFFQVALANEFLRETSDARLSERGASASLKSTIDGYRAEARFLRALSYWHGIDLFGDIALVKETDNLGAEPPQEATRQEIFNFIESELLAISPLLPAARQNQYGRADRAAADMLLAKLYLNAQVYTGQDRSADARAAAERVIASGYQLDPNYRHMFLADNHNSPEIIFPITFDGQNTRTWGGMTFLVHAAVGGNMNAGNYGIDGGWWGLRAKPELVEKFPGQADSPDSRADIFFTNGQTLDIQEISQFNQGYAAPKFSNVSSSGQPGVDARFPDTDFPMFRLADAYLMYAEAVLRGGGGSRAQALQYVNAVRERAYDETSGAISDAELTLDFILDERARELFWEGHRRTDLIRFGVFTGGEYLWTFKGGAPNGTATPEFRNLYPIPVSDLLANPNLTQNPGY